MKKPNTIEDDIDRIRLKIHKATKNMTPVQYAEYINKSSEAAVQKLGFQFVIGSDNKRFLVKIHDPIAKHP